jgi:hypothetical protein
MSIILVNIILSLYFLLRTLRCFGEVFILSRSPRLALIKNFDQLGSSGPRETQMSSEAWSDKKTAVLDILQEGYLFFR